MPTILDYLLDVRRTIQSILDRIDSVHSDVLPRAQQRLLRSEQRLSESIELSFASKQRILFPPAVQGSL